LPVIWILLVNRLTTDGVASFVDAALVATVSLGAVAAGVVLVARWWAARVAAEGFIVRERGVFTTGGSLLSRALGDKTVRFLRTPGARIRLDDGDPESGLDALWERLQTWPPNQPLEVDYTPHKYLLSVRDTAGAVLFARRGYAPPSVVLDA
jgi:hypothetical protein